ncbi:30S ribosomal protein S12 methylthiotransferase RimO [Granulicella cerasi]|uniref:Ribosomal protein uS12 methylthiotransferase RimO n=1 Tax=Granulicella cerasi TaxID=741063 RepID=A0ABW1ZC77_9BACT|nr:30S ribosomal protein S12 methylthiotransferase RimO [Granulicella cerasi]
MSLSSTLSPEAENQIEKPRPKVGFISLGCPKNLVDSEVMMGLLHSGGAEITPCAEDADILVVNTCSFIDSAKQESVDTILEMVNHKVGQGGRAQKLIVAGCLVERYRDEIQKNIPEVDAVVGTGELEAIIAAAGLKRPAPAELPASPFNVLTTAQIERHASAVNQHSRPEGSGPQIANETTSRPEGDAREAAGRFSRENWDGATAALPTYLYTADTPRILATPKASAYIKIAEGCDHPCSFCIIPQLRGKFRSRPIESIVREAQQLIAQGVREITLIGQDTTCFGEDLPKDEITGKRPELADLLDALAPLPGLKWLRFLYAYPNKITTRLLEAIARHDNVAKYLDVPLQHASANVLRRMKRGGTADRFLQIIEKARKIVPNLVLRTSFIVGFPGETEEDFEELCAFVTAAKLDWLGVFSYSDEEGAGAFDLDQKVPKRTIEARRRKLMRLQNKISRNARKAWIGRVVDVLVEGESEETELLWQGRSLDMAPEIDGKVLINDFGPHEALVPGTFYRAEITEAHDYDVVATILE